MDAGCRRPFPSPGFPLQQAWLRHPLSPHLPPARQNWLQLTIDVCCSRGAGEARNPGVIRGQLGQRSSQRLSPRQVGVGEAGGVESSPWRWQQAEKALLSAAQGSHEWRCKQPKREGTFPLAESAVKRFPVTVIAAFGGIISVETVGRGGEGRGGRERHPETSGLLARSWRPQPAASGSQVPDAQRLFWGRWSLDKRAGPPPSLQMDGAPFSGVLVGAAHSSHAALARIPWVTVRASSNVLGSWIVGGKAPRFCSPAAPQNRLHPGSPRPAEAPGRDLGTCA